MFMVIFLIVYNKFIVCVILVLSKITITNLSFHKSSCRKHIEYIGNYIFSNIDDSFEMSKQYMPHGNFALHAINKWRKNQITVVLKIFIAQCEFKQCHVITSQIDLR